MISTYNLTLDITKEYAQSMLDVKQGDGGPDSRKIVFSLSDGGSPVDLTNVIAISLMAKKPSGATILNGCTIRQDGKVEYRLTSQTTAELGVLECEIAYIYF